MNSATTFYNGGLIRNMRKEGNLGPFQTSFVERYVGRLEPGLSSTRYMRLAREAHEADPTGGNRREVLANILLAINAIQKNESPQARWLETFLRQTIFPMDRGQNAYLTDFFFREFVRMALDGLQQGLGDSIVGGGYALMVEGPHGALRLESSIVG